MMTLQVVKIVVLNSVGVNVGHGAEQFVYTCVAPARQPLCRCQQVVSVTRLDTKLEI